ncbi:isoamylase early set domain-containing protein [Pontibacter actiniarum]|uniref:AMP-activated protein kinase glycogen-binding domain-containing protein n=1 Tax=Pontibacter actiniarum TaxID=323450 RepID=A0A1X9YP13_9BACT|nr:isoamylase early set domain-containing protein [Pontibacter actiniarum]ARS34599.1 hypothetical protein CA264_03585 [Pontibacter actiniarum]
MIQKTYLKTKDQCKVKFTVSIENAERVEVVGLNNDWDNPIEMNRKKGGTFETVQSLPKNTQHEFKYLVNGTEWRNEPEADSEVPNEFGGTNSVLTV